MLFEIANPVDPLTGFRFLGDTSYSTQSGGQYGGVNHGTLRIQGIGSGMAFRVVAIGPQGAFGTLDQINNFATGPVNPQPTLAITSSTNGYVLYWPNNYGIPHASYQRRRLCPARACWPASSNDLMAGWVETTDGNPGTVYTGEAARTEIQHSPFHFAWPSPKASAKSPCRPRAGLSCGHLLDCEPPVDPDRRLAIFIRPQGRK
jgi:hypothetical protein